MPKGGNYTLLRNSLTICLLTQTLFDQSSQGHHRFQLTDKKSGRELSDTVEVHTVELLKYNLNEQTIRTSSVIDQWAFYFLRSEEKNAEELRRLLPGASFESAISTLSEIQEKTEFKQMYDQREKSQMDYQWAMESKYAEGKAEGKAEGEVKGVLIGKIQALQVLADEAERPTESFSSWTISTLESELDRLQQVLRSRNG